MRKVVFLIFAWAASWLLIFGAQAGALDIYQSGTVGLDVSYPNCSAKIPQTAFGIVGVNHGLLYSYNNCLVAEAASVSNLSLYMNTGWYNQSTHINSTSPLVCSAADANCLAYNYGYNAALDSLSYSGSQSVRSTTWWLDIETANSWNSDVIQNRNSLQGSYDALKNNGILTIGVYSTSAQWQSITGGWQNNWPNWGATTWATSKQAAKYCSGHAFTGGLTYLVQYSGKLDQNYAC